MNARFSRLFLSIVLMIVLALGLLPAVQAQEGPKPEAVGFRPDAPAYALHGPYWVGTREFVIDEGGERPLPVTAWYPALNPEGVEGFIDYNQYYPYLAGLDPAMQGQALQNAAPDVSGTPYPLVVYSHGSMAMRDNSYWLLEHMASYGLVVLAPDHPGDAMGDYFAMASGQTDPEAFTKAEILELSQRPMDIHRVIAFADTLTAQGGALEGLIDMDKIGVSGWSFGSYTAVLAAGARLDVGALKTWCTENPDLLRLGWFDQPVEICQIIDHPELQTELASAIGIEAPLNGMWPQLNDPRVDTAVLLAPCYAMAFDHDGAQALDVPFLMLSASGDTSCPQDREGYPYYDNIGSATKAKVIFENADHQIFNWTCGGAWNDPAFYSFCSDAVWDLDRTHDLTNHFTTAFLLATLKGDTDAAAALAPDAVSFPGITFEEQGF
jgi:predicted dienelactone hydrolase